MRRGNHRKFGRETGQRKALQKSLVTALIDHGSIKTTQAKAKTLKSAVDRMITVAKRQNLNSRRLLSAELGPKAVKKLVDELAPSLNERKGGYTRIIRLGQRHSDGAEMALVEFINFKS